MIVNINRDFIVMMALAAVSALVSVVLHLPVPVVMVLELGPLCFYFFRLYVHGKNGLSPTAIDSVYYFGFIVTILSLAGSVMRVYVFGIEKDMSGLIAQFGVGLLATGLALVFRLILTAHVESLNAKDLSQTIDEYVRSIATVVSKVEASAASFEGLAQSLEDRTRAIVEATFEEYSAGMDATAKVFAESITRVTEQAAFSVLSFSAMVESVAVTSHVKDFDTNIVELNSGLAMFAAEMSKYGRESTEVALVSSKRVLDESARQHAENLQAMSDLSRSSLQDSIDAIAELELSVDTSAVKGDLMALSRAVTSFTKRFAELDDKMLAANARANTELLVPIVEKFSTDLQRTADVVETTTQQQYERLAVKVADEAARGVSAVADMARAETAQQTRELASHIERLILTLERQTVAFQAARMNERIDNPASSSPVNLEKAPAPHVTRIA